MRKFLSLCLIHFVFSFSAIAQTLTISSSGETLSPGKNWIISGNTLTVADTANIRASVIQDHLTNTGPLEVVGNINNSAVSENEFNSAVSLDIEFVFEKNPAKYECY